VIRCNPYRPCLIASALGLLALLAGCGVRFNQIETARRLVPKSAAQAETLARYAWTLTLNGSKFVLYPVEARGTQVLFASGDGLQLRWDGSSIIVVDGMPGAFGRYESGIEANGVERWYAQAGRSMMRTQCSKPVVWRLSETRSGWRQACTAMVEGRSVRSHHAVELDGEQMVTRIEASIVPGGAQLLLERNQ
jgi:hypothetical protein